MKASRTPTIVLTREGDVLRCLAAQKSLMSLYVAAAAVAAVLLFILYQIFQSAMQQSQRGRDDYTIEFIVTALWLSIAIAAVYAIAVAVRRHKMPRGVIIEQGTVTVLTPDQPTPSHRLERRNLLGAAMKDSGLMPNRDLLSPRADLLLRTKNNGVIRALIGLDHQEIAAAVTSINEMVVITQYKGFEVLVATAPDPAAMPVLRVEPGSADRDGN